MLRARSHKRHGRISKRPTLDIDAEEEQQQLIPQPTADTSSHDARVIVADYNMDTPTRTGMHAAAGRYRGPKRAQNAAARGSSAGDAGVVQVPHNSRSSSSSTNGAGGVVAAARASSSVGGPESGSAGTDSWRAAFAGEPKVV
jgi:hypothetical protein